MRFIKTVIALLFMSNISLMAQKDTLYFTSKGKKVEDKTVAKYYTIVTKKNTVEIKEEFDISGRKESYYMYKKLPILDNTSVGSDKKDSKKKGEPDSTMVKHGNFLEWYESGELKMRGAYFAGKFQGTFETFYKNGKPKRQDNYALDSLKSGHCFDSLGNEIKHFPYYIQPEFKGGAEALFKFLGTNTKYAAYARERGIQGVVYVKFVVEKDGSVGDIEVKKGVHKTLDEESTRVVGLMPKWAAGKLDGENARVSYTLPISFKME
jgi:periplasmic protein TonB